ncbi:hypothetical protein LGK95_10405 [Clostridium algoriphilum]|uniref:DUF6625 family protein n=1 Tax=Clostridium algoriphilum TaxID=198347 RepID=UPI001CF14B70|nr:DUF6625 family protein [Clostridium algoriphilum]MCB2293931.1 hypothetical protein [Clostridium algoriphilum]
MEKIAIIIPYFGAYPNYFNLWLFSAGYNPSIDFYIITDIKTELNYPPNVHVVPMSFEDVKKKIQSLFNFIITLDSPYKLCDYKPAYGLIFNEIIEGYDFWGHCDGDIIWGNLRKFLIGEVLNSYERIYSRGHLTLYKNNEKMNNLFLKEHYYKQAYTYKEAFSTQHACGYDEWGDSKFGMGISWIAEKEGIKNYDKIDFADIKVNKFEFELAGKQNSYSTITFRWKDGELNCVYYNEEEIKEKEIAYLHLQKRKMIDNTKELIKGFVVIPNQFIDNTQNITKTQLDEWGKLKWVYVDWHITRAQGIVKRVKNGALKQLFYRKKKMKS